MGMQIQYDPREKYVNAEKKNMAYQFCARDLSDHATFGKGGNLFFFYLWGFFFLVLIFFFYPLDPFFVLSNRVDDKR